MARLLLLVAVLFLNLGCCFVHGETVLVLCPGECSATWRARLSAGWAESPSFHTAVASSIIAAAASAGHSWEVLRNIDVNSGELLQSVLRAVEATSLSTVHLVVFSSSVQLQPVIEVAGGPERWWLTIVVDDDARVPFPPATVALPNSPLTPTAAARSAIMLPWSAHAPFIAGAAAADQSVSGTIALLLPLQSWQGEAVTALFTLGVEAQSGDSVRIVTIACDHLGTTKDVIRELIESEGVDVVVAVGHVANVAAYEMSASPNLIFSFLALFSDPQHSANAATEFPLLLDPDALPAKRYVLAVDTHLSRHTLSLKFLSDHLAAVGAELTNDAAAPERSHIVAGGALGTPLIYLLGNEGADVRPCVHSCATSVAFVTALQVATRLRSGNLQLSRFDFTLFQRQPITAEPPAAPPRSTDGWFALQAVPGGPSATMAGEILTAAVGSDGSSMLLLSVDTPPLTFSAISHTFMFELTQNLRRTSWMPPGPAELPYPGNRSTPIRFAITSLPNGSFALHGGQRGERRLTELTLVTPSARGMQVAEVTTHTAGDAADVDGRVQPLGRSQHTVTANGTTHLLLYGGVCTTISVPCGDFWTLDLLSLEWRPLPVPPDEQGRFDHGAVMWPVAMTVSGVRDTAWLVVVGGAYTATFFRPMAFGVHREEWVPLPLPATPTPVRKPCLLTVGNRLFVVGGDGEGFASTTILVFSATNQQWGALEPDEAAAFEWSGGATSCGVGAADPQHGFKAMLAPSAIAGSDPPRHLISVLSVTFARCGAGQVLDAAGTRCITCPDLHLVMDELCVPCSAVDTAQMSTDQRRTCFDRDTLGGIIGFIGILISHLLVVPVYSLFVFAQQGVEDARANRQAASDLTHAIANFKFGRVAYLESLRSPTRIQRALRQCSRNLHRTRNYFPALVFAIISTMARRSAGSGGNGASDCDSTIGRPHPLDGSSSLTAVAPHAPRSDDVRTGRQHQAHLAHGSVTSSGAMAGSLSSGTQDDDERQHLLVNRVLRALEPRLMMCELTVLSSHLADFDAWCERQQPAALSARINHFLDGARQLFATNGGVVEAVQGDRLLVVFNSPALPLRHHRLVGCAAAIKLASHKTVTSLGVSCSMALATRAVPCGVVGGTTTKRFHIGGAIIKEAIALCSACSSLNAGVLVRWGGASDEAALGVHLVYQFVAESRLFEMSHGLGMAAPAPVAHHCAFTAGAAASVTWFADDPAASDDELDSSPAEGDDSCSGRGGGGELSPRVVVSRALLADVLGHVDDRQWVDVRRGHKEHLRLTNRILRMVYERQLTEARAIDCRSLPPWFAGIIEGPLAAGRLHSIDLPVI